MLMRNAILAIAIALMSTLAIAQADQKTEPSATPDLKQLQAMIARFAPTELTADTSKLSRGDQKALVKLIQAARVMDDVYMTQLWAFDQALYARLKNDTSPQGRARLHYFWINKGPWSDLDEHTAFLPGVPARKPLGANFYPESASKSELEGWLKGLPAKEREAATGFFTVIEKTSGASARSKAKKTVNARAAQAELKIVPYSDVYGQRLLEAAGLLR